MTSIPILRPHAVEFKSGNQWFNFYCDAISIDHAEQQAATWGIKGEGFEIVHAQEVDEATAKAYRYTKGAK